MTSLRRYDNYDVTVTYKKFSSLSKWIQLWFSFRQIFVNGDVNAPTWQVMLLKKSYRATLTIFCVLGFFFPSQLRILFCFFFYYYYFHSYRWFCLSYVSWIEQRAILTLLHFTGDISTKAGSPNISCSLYIHLFLAMFSDNQLLESSHSMEQCLFGSQTLRTGPKVGEILVST